MLYALKHKEGLDVYDAFEESFKEYGLPRSIVTDNGTEFHNELINSLLEKHKIHHISGQSYNAKANAIAEASNGFVRQILRALFVQKGNTIWYNSLQDIMKTINDTAPESTGIPRSVLYFNGDKKFKTKIKRINEIKRTENQPKFSVGDIVRISKQVLDKEVRKQIKQGNSKLVIVQFSKELYRVVKVLQSKKLIKSNAE
jgi:hypothetical protein